MTSNTRGKWDFITTVSEDEYFVPNKMNLQNKRIVDFLKTELPEIQLIYIFGSEAQGMTNPESDLDIAVLCPIRLQSETLWNLRLALSNLHDREVDLVDLRADNAVLNMEIIYHGVCIYKLNDSFWQLFECRVIEEYLDLKELIRDMEEEIKVSGKIFNY